MKFHISVEQVKRRARQALPAIPGCSGPTKHLKSLSNHPATSDEARPKASLGYLGVHGSADRDFNLAGRHFPSS
jgi:hypothetical protein